MSFDMIQKVYRFPNSLGASVVCHEFSYGGKNGLWELALIRFKNMEDPESWEFYYHDLTNNDVVGWLSQKDVEELLEKIKALPAPPPTPP
jgi:hypothetical protein